MPFLCRAAAENETVCLRLPFFVLHLCYAAGIVLNELIELIAFLLKGFDYFFKLLVFVK